MLRFQPAGSGSEASPFLEHYTDLPISINTPSSLGSSRSQHIPATQTLRAPFPNARPSSSSSSSSASSTLSLFDPLSTYYSSLPPTPPKKFSPKPSPTPSQSSLSSSHNSFPDTFIEHIINLEAIAAGKTETMVDAQGRKWVWRRCYCGMWECGKVSLGVAGGKVMRGLERYGWEEADREWV
ncbi:hypothetical protein P154DRAFT_529045 [Amniculicola lignicola CBS 123094]|uniref:Uncharacterized protein n=1 Tax=Amniculicola lignicola CBS 123094 TaxID=1392246 RepID=A0A6A5X3F1_9PLEO|nr:hypothetical protein P154DRAFT_529045 [Amniculicola lignicola CBS 123094]